MMSQSLARSRAPLVAAISATVSTTVAATVLAFVAPRRAWAEDDRSDSLTVLPQTGVGLAVSSVESRAVVDVTQLSRLTLFSLRASAPLDAESRFNEFVDEGLMTSGFSASMLIGLDQRAWVLKQANERMARIATAVEVLRTPALNMDLRSAFVRKHGLRNEPNAIARYFCDGRPEVSPASEAGEPAAAPAGGAGAAAAAAAAAAAPGAARAAAAAPGAAPAAPSAAPPVEAGPCEMTVQVPRGICTALERPCDDAFDLAAAATEASRAIIGGAACAGFIDGRDIDRCFAASWWLLAREREVNARKIAVYFREPGSVEKTWDTFASVDAKRARLLLAASGGRKASALIDNRDEVIGVLRAAHRAIALERRDLLTTGLSTTKYELYSVLFDASLGYDRYDVVAANSDSLLSTERSRLAVGVNYTKYLRSTPGLAINLRGGFEHAQSSGAIRANCDVFDPRLPANCEEDRPLLIADTPDDVSSLYVRGAILYQWRDQLATNSWIPGMELRGGFENVGQGAVGTLRPTLFATFLRGPVAVRAGVAFDMSYRLDEDSIDLTARSRWRVAPMFVIGGTFASLPELE